MIKRVNVYLQSLQVNKLTTESEHTEGRLILVKSISTNRMRSQLQQRLVTRGCLAVGGPWLCHTEGRWYGAPTRCLQSWYVTKHGLLSIHIVDKEVDQVLVAPGVPPSAEQLRM